LTVVIPTRDRGALLADCLASLRDQTPPPGGWEVVVVDDGSTEPLRPLVEASLGHKVALDCIRLDGAGLNAARNAGVERANGELIAFLDDDTLVEDGWTLAIHEAFTRQGCEAIGGRVTLALEDGAEFPRWLTRKRHSYLSSYELGDFPREVEDPPLPVGANFAITAAALNELGGFRQGLDRIGTELISNGEYELLLRLLESGGRIVYWPAAAVRHRVPAERLTKEWFRRRARAQGVSDIRMQPVDGQNYPLRWAAEAARGGRALPILVRRLAERRGAFDAELWLIDCRARLEELRRQRAARA
jgi:glycosyltransferase involved in cell wall biosynthesis